MSAAYVRSNMGLVHAVVNGRAVCGTMLRDSWEATEVASWPSEPNVCRSCDDVVMSRGRRSAALAARSPSRTERKEG